MEAHQKQITVYSNHTESAPVIYLPVVVGDGSEVYKCCRELDCPPFTLVAIGGLDWNRELSPWACDGTVRDAEPFGGQAAGFLDELLNQIIPRSSRRFLGRPPGAALPATRWQASFRFGLSGKPMPLTAPQAHRDPCGFLALSTMRTSTPRQLRPTPPTCRLAKRRPRHPTA